METEAHIQLKRIAAAFLLREGFQAVATEVRTPIMRFRADAAGYLDRAPLGPGVNHLDPLVERQPDLPFSPPPGPRPACDPRTVIIECKQSRADFLRDQRDLERLLTIRRRLHERRQRFEEDHIKRAEPHLRRSGEFLFRQMERWDFQDTRSGEYRRLIARLERAERRLHGETKLFRIARYRLADRLYLLAPRAMIKPNELPAGWGLLECPASWSSYRRSSLADLAGTPLTLARPAPDQNTRPVHRARLLRNIAVAATGAALRADRAASCRKRPAAVRPHADAKRAPNTLPA